MIFAQWPARSQPTVAAVCILALVPYISGSTLRYETIGALCDLFLLNLFSCHILLTCRRALVGWQIDSMGTSIVALRLTCARLHFHVSGASKPREASGASAGNSGCSFSGSASSLITSLRPCSGWGCPDALGTAKSSNQVGRTDWTPIHWRNLHSFFVVGARCLSAGRT